MDPLGFKKPPLYQVSFETRSGGLLLDGCAEGLDPRQEEFLRWAPQDSCTFCSTYLELLDARGIHGEDDEGTWFDAQQFVLGCLNCGWWRYEFTNGGESMQFSDVAVGCILRVENERRWAPVPILREHIARHPDFLRKDVDPIAFEQVLKDVFSDFYQVEVRWTGRGADGGFDLYHVISDETTVYQVKRRGLQVKAESVVPIRALLGTMVIQGAVAGIYVTTADRFTKVAEREAKAAQERGLKLELMNYDRLMDILRSTAPKNLRPYDVPWRKDAPTYDRFATSIRHPVGGFMLLRSGKGIPKA